VHLIDFDLDATHQGIHQQIIDLSAGAELQQEQYIQEAEEHV